MIYSIIRDNLMVRELYTPYCGNENCPKMPRTFFNGDQFKCHICGWVSEFPIEFIKDYKEKWGKL